ncbi:lysyl endopeptidase [Burkholderiales bacterium]|nr:lysyl endopeptidase [Burkholderiales bacterium]
MVFRLWLGVLVAALAVPAQAQGLVTSVRGAEHRPATAAKAVPAPRMRLAGAAMAHRVALEAPTSAEREKLIALNRASGPAFAAPGRPQYVGFGREISVAKRSVDASSLTWTTLADGVRVARIEVASPGAASLRVAVRMAATHPDVAVRFAAPSASEAAISVTADAIAQATGRFGEYWSPVIEGERAAIEVEAGAGATLAGVALDIARVSHMVVSARMSKQDAAKRLVDIGDAGACNFDVKCVEPQDSVTLNQAAATGKLVFTVPSGGTALCTGTMINDNPPSSAPYLFSASHCFDNAYSAFTLNVWWFFEAQACGSGTVGNYVQQAGGAMLIGRSQDWDWALLRLNTAPPGGVWRSGWTTAALAADTVVEIFHHPQGDLMKWSQGTTFAAVPVNFGSAAGGAGLFTRVVWFDGTTEGGSSGGALTTYDGVELKVRGGLVGGDALCSNPNGSDYFSQFGSMVPLVREYLTPDSQTPGQVVSVEYYHANLDHFFMTIDPPEIAALDSGQIAGWERTGLRFLAYTSPGAGRNPVCRFYRKPEFGDSHFFTADPAECARVAVDYATDWFFESPAIYYVALPNATTGACPAGTKPVYRFLNVSEINHRYTTEQALAFALSATPGWIAEGYGPGPLYPVMCAPVGA